MRDYIIMTDSCCDLNQQEVDELGLTVLPLSFTIDGKTYLNTPDHAEMSPEEFFAKIAAGENSTTAAANVGQFDEAMRRALDAGKDILCICFSGALLGRAKHTNVVCLYLFRTSFLYIEVLTLYKINGSYFTQVCAL